jgi:formylmethanofuran dehydrogenase subunit B
VTDRRVACPFCGLVCDDLVASGNGVVDSRGCALGAAGFRRGAVPRRSHAVAGTAVDFATATTAAAVLLKAATAPVFHGLAVDLAGIRALFALAERVGGAVDHLASSALLANAAVARASGWVVATFAEIANRADFILIIGNDPARAFPRFHERLVDNANPLYRAGPPRIAYLGPAEEAPPRVAPSLQADVTRTELLPALAQLGALLHGRRPQSSTEPLRTIASSLAEARYGAIVWTPASFAANEAELAVEQIAAMLRHLNATTRCVGLPLGGSGNGLGAMQASLWQTGWPLRLGFGEGTPRHDPWRFAGDRMLSSDEADALVWATTLVAEAPPATSRPVIALIPDDLVLPSPAAIEIRVGMPGIDHDGEIFRSDTVIALPLQATRPSDRPSVAAAASAILAKLQALP